MERPAQFFSFVFSPLLIPTYAVGLAMWVSLLFFLPPSPKWSVVGITFIITCLVPLAAIFTLWRLGKVSDPGLNKQGERTIPYVIMIACYLACTLFMRHIGAPKWLSMFMVGGIVAAIVSTLINRRWKISAHMAAMGGLVGLLFRILNDGVSLMPNMLFALTGAIVAAGLVGTSRLILERHTLMQVIAGFANGFIWVYLLSAF